MRKIYFTKQEVQIGDSFLYGDLRVIITHDLVQDNPHLFSVEGSAAEDYPEPEELLNLITTSEDANWQEKKIEDCKLNNRAINALKRADIETLGDLSIRSYYEIRNVNNVGKLLYKDIINMMNREIPKFYHRKNIKY